MKFDEILEKERLQVKHIAEAMEIKPNSFYAQRPTTRAKRERIVENLYKLFKG